MIEVEDGPGFSDTKLKLISENVNELISIVDTDRKIEFINKIPHLKILGYHEKDLMGNSWLNLVHPEDLKKVRNTLKINAKRKDLIKEIRLRDKNGNFKKFDLVVRAFVDYDSSIKFMLFLKNIAKFEDIRKIKKKLKESEEKFRNITEQSLLGIIILQDNKIKYINNTAAQIVDYTPDELLNLPPGGFINLIYSEDRKIVIEFAKKRQRGMKTKITGYECRCLKKNGDIIWIQNYSKTIIYNNKFADFIVVIDITDKKRAEIKLHESEQRLKYLLSSSTTVIYTTDPSRDYKFTFISENIKDILGYNPEEIINDPEFWISNIHPEDREIIQVNLSKVFKNENLGFVYRFKSKNGIYHWIRDEIKLISDKKGKPLECIGTWADITVNKQIEEKVRFQAKLVDGISDAIISTDLNFNIITWNKAAERIYGWKAEEVKRKNVKDIIPIRNPYNDQKSFVKQLFKYNLWKGEVVQKKKDGTTLNILTSVSIIKDKTGEPIGVVAINRDITEYKKAERKIRESEKKLVELIEAVPVGVSITTSQGEILECNSHALKIFGYDSKEEFLKTRVLDYYNDHNDFDRFIKLIQSGEVKDFETQFRRKDGSIFWASLTSITQMNRKQTLFINSFEDITDRKLMEVVLRESEARLRVAIESLPFDFFMLNENGYYIMQNTACKENWGDIIGKCPKDVALNENILNIWENNNSRAFFGETVAGEVKYEINGGVQYFYNIINPIYIDNKIQNIIGVNIDITQRKLAEKELKESEEKFRIIAEQSTLGIIIHQEGLIKYVNSAVSDIIEYPPQKIKEWTIEDIFKIIYKEDLPHVIEYFKKHQYEDSIEVFKYNCRIITKSKKLRWIEFIFKSIVYRGKKAMLLSIVDVTKRKEVEEELKEISRLKSELLDRTSHELKTPLIAIKGYTDLLLYPKYSNLDFQTISIIEEIEQGCNRMEIIIKDLLTASKFKSSYIELNKSEEDLSFLIRFCVKNLQGLAKSRNHTMILDIQDSLLTMVEKERIYEVIMNLLSNAINYTPPNGIIKIKSEAKKGFYVISIKDNGIGFTRQETDNIFKKFGKVERYGKGMDIFSEGFGLGLYISKKIVKLHGGNIWVGSKGRNKGSTFSFSLPIINR